MDAPELAQIRDAVMNGGTTVSDVDHLRGVCSTALRMCKRLGVPYSTIGGAQGPFTNPITAAGTVLEQLSTARWLVSADQVARNAGELLLQISECVKQVDATADVPTPAPASGWKTLPVVTKALMDGDTSSFQNTAPTFAQSGMHIVMPATGKDSGAVNPPPAGSDYQRCEITVNGEGGVTGGRRFYRFVWELGAGFPSDVTDWEVLAQWKGDGSGSPPLSIECRNGNFILTWHKLPTDPVGAPVVIGPATAGVHDVIVDVTFSTSAASSPVSAWIDGRQTVTAVKVGATLYSGKASRLKTGLYRSASIAQAADLTLRGFAAGSTFADVTT